MMQEQCDAITELLAKEAPCLKVLAIHYGLIKNFDDIHDSQWLNEEIHKEVRRRIFETEYYPALKREIAEYNVSHLHSPKSVPDKDETKKSFVEAPPHQWNTRVGEKILMELELIKRALEEGEDPLKVLEKIKL